MKRGGYTLLEILIVLAVLGILLAIGFMSFLHALRVSELRQAAQQIASDLREARSASQRYNLQTSLNVLSSRDYELTSQGGARRRTLPQGTELSCSGGCSSTPEVIYHGPFGEVEATGTVLEVRGAMGLNPLFVKVVGVTGKVILSAEN